MMIHLSDTMTLGKVSLKVKDFDTMLDFYQNKLGMSILEQTDHKTVLGTKTHELVALIHDEQFQLPMTHHTGLFHFALLLPERNDLLAMIQFLQSHDVQISGAADHLFSEAIYLNDPEGNGIEIYIDRDRKVWVHLDDGSLKGVSDPLDIDALIRDFDGRILKSLPDNTSMGHIHLSVSNIADSERFYSENLNFENQTSMPGARFVSKGQYHHHIGMNTWNTKGASQLPKNITGLVSYEIYTDNYDDVKDALLKSTLNYVVADDTLNIFDNEGVLISIRKAL